MYTYDRLEVGSSLISPFVTTIIITIIASARTSLVLFAESKTTDGLFRVRCLSWFRVLIISKSYVMCHASRLHGHQTWETDRAVLTKWHLGVSHSNMVPIIKIARLMWTKTRNEEVSSALKKDPYEDKARKEIFWLVAWVRSHDNYNIVTLL